MQSIDPTHNILAQARKKKAILFVRQSSERQRRNNTGSGAIQLDELRYITGLGWLESRIEVIDARGESGCRGGRDKFHELLNAVKAGTVGLVVIARQDRLGRREVDNALFQEAARDTGTMILAGGRLYNPASEVDDMMFSMLGKFSEYENRARVRWVMLARWAKARVGQLRINTPTGFVWASPEDPEYVRRLQEAGLGHHLQNLDQHKVKSQIEGRSYYVLPYPDRDVFRSVELRIRWLLETGSIGALLDRIDSDPEWPQKGKIPVMIGSRWSPNVEPQWRRGPRTRRWQTLRDWFRTPVVRGQYWVSAPKLASISMGAEAADFEVRINDAFPACISPEDIPRVDRALATLARPWKQGEYSGPRNNALDVVRCGLTRADCSPCGMRMSPVYSRDCGGSHRYQSMGCHLHGHSAPSIAGKSLDDLVLSTVLARFDPARLRSHLSEFALDDLSLTREVRELEDEKEGLSKRAKVLTEMEVQARLTGSDEDTSYLARERNRVLGQIASKEEAIAVRRTEAARLRELGQADLNQIFALCENLHSLVHRAQRTAPGALRALMRELVTAVYFRRISLYVYEVDIEYPTGERETRVAFIREFFVPQAARVWVCGRLEAGAEASEIAAELVDAPISFKKRWWNAERVLTAKYLHEYVPGEALRDGEHLSVTEIAVDAGVDRAEVFIAAIQGRLGPAIYRNGELHLCPTVHEIHSALPEAARRRVATEQDWPLEDTAFVRDLMCETGLDHSSVKYAASLPGRAGIARDEAGRSYTRRSDICIDFATALVKALEGTEFEHLGSSSAHWVRHEDAVSLFPGMSPDAIRRRAPHVRVRTGAPGIGGIYVYIGGDTLKEIEGPSTRKLRVKQAGRKT
jgi:DNA invertase Pin-like site-specific DNA recombinase